MNIDTGHVVSVEEYERMAAEEKERHVRVPQHMSAAAGSAMAAGESLFSGKLGGQRVRNQALALARKQKRKVRRDMAKASRRRNRG